MISKVRRQGLALQGYLIGGGLVAMAVVAAALVVAAFTVNGISSASEEEQVSNGLESRYQELRALVWPQANWDDTVENTQNHYNPEWVSTNIGAYHIQTAGFHRVYMLDAADRPIYARLGDDEPSPAAYSEVASALAPLIADLRKRETARGPFHITGPSDKVIARPIDASTTAMIGGAPMVLNASLVQPDFGVSPPLTFRAPIVITARAVDAAFVEELANRYLLHAAAITPLLAKPARGAATAYVRDAAGHPIAALRWSPRRPGFALLGEIWTILLIALVALIGAMVLLHRAGRNAFAAFYESQDHLKQALQEAEAANEAKSEFLASVSHEIRTPLNSVLGALHLMKSDKLTPEHHELVTNALSSGQMVNALINDVLDFSKMAAGAMSLEPEATDIAALIGSVRSAFGPACEAKGLALDVDLGHGLDWRQVDPLRLRQCLFNLVGNAVKFTLAGSVRVVASADGDRLTLSVIDTGIGIDRASLDRLFERFTQADSSTTRRFGGTGLGLAISRQLARAMGGDVTAQSIQGEGSAFTLTLAAPLVEAAAPKDTGLDDAVLSGFQILLVDDNAANLTIGSKILERLGAAVTIAQGGVPALDQGARQAFDLILMDIQMPDLDGMETTRRLRAGEGPNQHTPIVALTANLMAEQKAAYLAAGMNGVAAKPISPPDLLAELVRVFNTADEEEAAA